MEIEPVLFFNKILNLVSWIILTLSFILTAIVGIAQFSVPGDRTYPIKISFEKGVLFGYRLLNLDARYRIDLTELRFAETQKIIKTNRALLGLNNLINQITDTESSISQLKNPQKKAELAYQYITTLTNISYQLEKEKQIISTSYSAKVIPNQPFPTTAQLSYSFPLSNSPSPSIVQHINSAQEQISSTINRLQEIVKSNPNSESNTIIPAPTENLDQLIIKEQLNNITPTNLVPTKIPTLPAPLNLNKYKPNSEHNLRSTSSALPSQESLTSTPSQETTQIFDSQTSGE